MTSVVQGPWSFTDTTQSTSSTTGAVALAGGMGVAKTVTTGEGLLLPNGGTLLTNNEDPVSVTITWSGVLSGTSNWVFQKLGKALSVVIPAFTGTASSTGVFVGTAQVPARFRPAQDTFFTLTVINSGTVQTNPGIMRIIASSGTITVWRTLTTGNFNNGTTIGIYLPTVVSYLAAAQT